MCRGEKQTENKSLASADEGFEDARSGDFAKSSPRVSQINLVNAEKSRPKKIIEEPTKKTLTRGQILMSMIKLDTVEFSLYEAHPISYDEYIRTYGKLNSQQTYTQTNEDNLDVEIQTTGIELENKWTQFPVRCRGSLKTHDDVRQFKLDHLGCGGDAPDQSSFFAAPSYDVLRLTEFLDRAGKLVLALLEESEMGGDVMGSDTRDFPFSEGCVKLATGSISFLAGRQVRRLCYAESNHKILASVHASSHEKFQLTDKQDYIKDCCVGCVWNINEPSRPTKMFYSPSPVTACCFHCTNNNIVFAGNQDGSICLWDLREDETWHQRISDKTNEIDWIVRSSTYTTAGNVELSHSSTVVAIGTLLNAANLDSGQEESSSNDGFFNIQLCSLDEDGRLIVWSVIRNLTQQQQQQQRNAGSSSSNDKDLGLAQWGRVKLVKSQEVATRRLEVGGVAKCFVDMAVDQADSDNLYLAVNDTNVLYVNCAGGGRNSTPFYRINEMDSCGSTTCLEVFPFKRSYFLAGCKDGSIRLHSLHAETPLMKLKDEDSLAGIRSIQWSRSRPSIFYVLDDQSRIAVWDMLKSATKPIYVVATTNWESVKCIKLSPCNVERDKQNQYMAIGTYGGNVEVHKLKRDFYFSKQEDMQREMDAFLEFVSIL
ncbi:WD repeat-containing protein 60 [Trichogramma pretiosum]|uniref:WD repeat-containing protein 60 n=1 Tax=Trichogramma pretiosum TaxID=7493 RepID=UPI000C71B043|nr:WD repeat-containing protein 60 [Trichogramma pretiosum]